MPLVNILHLKNKKRFDKLNITMGNYYFNPSGVSVKEDFHAKRDKQHNEVIEKYYKDEPPSVFEFYNGVIKRNRFAPPSQMVIKR